MIDPNDPQGDPATPPAVDPAAVAAQEPVPQEPATSQPAASQPASLAPSTIRRPLAKPSEDANLPLGPLNPKLKGPGDYDAEQQYWLEARKAGAAAGKIRTDTTPFISMKDLGMVAPRAVINTIQGTWNLADDIATLNFLPSSIQPEFLSKANKALEWPGHPLGAPETIGGKLLTTGVEFMLPFQQVEKGVAALRVIVPAVGEAYRMIGLANETSRAMTEAGNAWRLAQQHGEVNKMVREAATAGWKAFGYEARAWASSTGRMTIDGALTEFGFAPGADRPESPDRMDRLVQGLYMGPAFMLGLNVLGRLVSTVRPMRFPSGVFEVPPADVGEMRSLFPEKFQPGTPLATPPGEKMIDPEAVKKLLQGGMNTEDLPQLRRGGPGVPQEPAGAPPSPAAPTQAPTTAEAPKVPEGAGAPSLTTLPKELAGAKPRYSYGQKGFDLQFASDTEKALFITAQAKKSARDLDYRNWLKAGGFSDEAIDKLGPFVRAHIKSMAKDADPAAGPLPVPGLSEMADAMQKRAAAAGQEVPKNPLHGLMDETPTPKEAPPQEGPAPGAQAPPAEEAAPNWGKGDSRKLLKEYEERRNDPMEGVPGGSKSNPRELTDEQLLSARMERGDLNFKPVIGTDREPFDMGRVMEELEKEEPTESVGRTMGEFSEKAADMTDKLLDEMHHTLDTEGAVSGSVLSPIIRGTPPQAQRVIGVWVKGMNNILHGVTRYLANRADQALSTMSDEEFCLAYAEHAVGVRALRLVKNTLYEMGFALRGQAERTVPIDADRVRTLFKLAAKTAENPEVSHGEVTNNVFLRGESRVSAADLKSAENVQQYLARNGGRGEMETRLRASAEYSDSKAPDMDPALRAKQMVMTLEQSGGPSFAGVMSDLLYGGILGWSSLLTTGLAQFVYGFAVRPFMGMGAGGAAAGIAALTGQKNLAGQYLRQSAAEMLNVAHIFNPRMWGQARDAGLEYLRSGKGQLLMHEGKLSDIEGMHDISSESVKYVAERGGAAFEKMGLGPDSPLVTLAGWLADGAGKTLRASGKGLQFIDVFQKQLVARQLAESEFVIEGLFDKHLPLGDAYHYADKRIEDIIKNYTLQTQSAVFRQVASQVAAEEAGDVTHKWSDETRAARVKELAQPLMEEYNKNSGLIDFIERRARDTAGDAPIPYNTVGGRILHAAQNNPFTFMFAPVLKSTYNLARLTVQPFDAPGLASGLIKQEFGADLPMLSKLGQMYGKDMQSANLRIRNEMIGRLMLAMSISSAFGYYGVQTDKDGYPLITGRDPSNRKRGIPDDSVLVGNNYYEYGRVLSVVGSMISMVSDVAKAHYNNASYVSDKDSSKMWSGIAMAMAHYIGHDNAFASIAKPLDVLLEGNAAKALRYFGSPIASIAGGPAILREGWEAAKDEFGAGDPYSRDVSTLKDQFMKKFPGYLNPFGIKGGTEEIMPERNGLGEPMPKPTQPFGLIPMRITHVSRDPVDMENYLTGALDEKPKSQIANGALDLSSISNAKGQTAYDRALELMGTMKAPDGLTLRERLRQILHEPAYQAMRYPQHAEDNNPRADYLRMARDAYWQMATMRAQAEFPEWSKAVGAPRKPGTIIERKKEMYGVKK